MSKHVSSSSLHAPDYTRKTPSPDQDATYQVQGRQANGLTRRRQEIMQAARQALIYAFAASEWYLFLGFSSLIFLYTSFSILFIAASSFLYYLFTVFYFLL